MDALEYLGTVSLALCLQHLTAGQYETLLADVQLQWQGLYGLTNIAVQFLYIVEINLGSRNECANTHYTCNQAALNNLGNLGINRLSLLNDAIQLLPGCQAVSLYLGYNQAVLATLGYNQNLDYIINLDNVLGRLRSRLSQFVLCNRNIILITLDIDDSFVVIYCNN